MKQLIKSASVYKVKFPDGIDLAAILSDERNQFREPGSVERYTTGSVVVPGTEEFVLDLAGMARVVAVRLADKILPASVVAVELEKRVAAIEERDDRVVGRKECAEIKDGIINELTARAMVRHKTIRVFHHVESGYLIVPNTSANLCDRVMSHLIHSIGALKTETIHVSDLKHGLTTRMKAWADADNSVLDDEPHLVMGDDFNLAGDITMHGETGKAKFSVGELENAKHGVREGLEKGMQVVEIGLQCADEDYEFRLTDGFKFKAINSGIEIEDAEDNIDALKSQVCAELARLVGVVNKLAELFGFDPNADAADSGPKMEAA